MKEVVIFLLIFFIVFTFALIILNGRFIYVQLKYHFIGLPPTPHEIEKAEWDRIIIPSIGIDAPIILAESTNENIIQKALEKGVVLYPDSNIILGHSSAFPWYRGSYGSIFSLLNKLEKDDTILVFSQKKKYTYQVSERQIKTPKDLNIKEKEESTLYLISCWPVNTNWKRIAIKAQRVDNN